MPDNEQIKITARRPLEDDFPDGLLESDKDWVSNNFDACVWFLENAKQVISILAKGGPEERAFPMQDGPDIPWKLAEEVYVMYSKIYGTSQSLERLAERGGFGWSEVSLLWKKGKRRNNW